MKRYIAPLLLMVLSVLDVNAQDWTGLNSEVNAATISTDATLRASVHDSLVKQIDETADPATRNLFIEQLNKLTTEADFPYYMKLAANPDTRVYALMGLANMPGVDAQITSAIKAAKAPDAALAYLAYFRGLRGVEGQLLKWAVSPDAAARTASLNALSVCGTKKSLSTLRASGDTDAYLRLLDNLSDAKTVAQKARKLIESDDSYLRCAGLRLLLKANPADAAAYAVAALKDGDKAYRHTALLYGVSSADAPLIPSLVAKYNSFTPYARVELLTRLGELHAASQLPLILSAAEDHNPGVSAAAIEAASKIGGEQAMNTLVGALADPARKEVARQALLTFNGNITPGVLSALRSEDASVLEGALALASERRISTAYPRVLVLAKSDNNEVKTAACRALSGVATADNFNDLCDLLDSADDATLPLVQDAASAVMQTMDETQRNKLTNARVAATKHPQAYFPLLAACGTPEAIESLTKGLDGEYRAAAVDGILKVQNPACVEAVFAASEKVSDADRARLLDHCVNLATRAGLDDAKACSLYGRILACTPDAGVCNKVMEDLRKHRTIDAANLAIGYFNNADVAYAAATTYADIIEKTPELQHGKDVRANLVKAVDVFKDQNARGVTDAAYAVKRVNLIIDNWK